jgi:N-acetyl-anhydromuramyl-L-alanine amidase AmpD
MLDIAWVGMTRQHYQPGSAERIRMLVLHATAGRHPGDLAWLRKGGDPRRPVSCHYYIDKSGRISQLVRDHDIAWHAGVSRWLVDGRVVVGCNAVSLGIELENRNDGVDPYPDAQVHAAVALSRHLVKAYQIPPGQLVRHRDISPGRKTDPAGLDWALFTHRVYLGHLAPLTPDSPIIAPPPSA